MLCHQVWFQESRRRFSALLKIRLNCSHSWQHGQLALSTPNRSLPPTMMMFSAPISKMSEVSLYAHMKKLTHCMFLHLEDTVHLRHSRVSVNTDVYTDVVVLAIAAAPRLDISKLMVAFGVGRSFRFLSAYMIARAPVQGCSHLFLV